MPQDQNQTHDRGRSGLNFLLSAKGLWNFCGGRAGWISAAFALCVACTPQVKEPISRSAQFEDYPQDLFNAFQAACQDPGETISQVGPRGTECRQLMSPETTAFLILNFDGYPQKLPQSVMRLNATQNQAGYLVDADMFILVPQKSGQTLKLGIESPSLDRQLSKLYRAAGGAPVPEL